MAVELSWRTYDSLTGDGMCVTLMYRGQVMATNMVTFSLDDLHDSFQFHQNELIDFQTDGKLKAKFSLKR